MDLTSIIFLKPRTGHATLSFKKICSFPSYLENKVHIPWQSSLFTFGCPHFTSSSISAH